MNDIIDENWSLNVMRMNAIVFLLLQIQDYYSCNGIMSGSQHVYRESHSRNTVLVEMTDNWLTPQQYYWT